MENNINNIPNNNWDYLLYLYQFAITNVFNTQSIITGLFFQYDKELREQPELLIIITGYNNILQDLLVNIGKLSTVHIKLDNDTIIPLKAGNVLEEDMAVYQDLEVKYKNLITSINIITQQANAVLFGEFIRNVKTFSPKDMFLKEPEEIINTYQTFYGGNHESRAQ